MLFVPNYAGALCSNTPSWGTARLSNTMGTSVTPDTGGYGSYAAVGSALTSAAYGVRVLVHNNYTNGTIRETILNIGYDPAGGTSYSVLIPDLQCGGAGTPGGGGGEGTIEYVFPLYIPSGATLAAAAYSNVANAFYVGVQVFQSPISPESIKCGTFVQAIGTSGRGGAAVTPGTASEGAWTSIGTTTAPMWYWQVGWGGKDPGTVLATNGVAIDVAVGDGANYNIIIQENYRQVDTTERIGMMGSQGLQGHYHPVPSGATLYARAQVSGGTVDTDGNTVIVYGVG